MDSTKHGSSLLKLVENKKFQNFIMTIIVINSVIIGLETYPHISSSRLGDVLKIIDHICLLFFVGELVLKIAAYRLKFFKNSTNLFDFFIVATSLLSSLSFMSVFRIMRIFRVFRTLRSLRSLRMISGLERLKTIVVALEKSISSIVWTVLLLSIVYYIFAVVGTTLFGSTFPEWFGSLSITCYTLFQVMTLESWSMGIARPVMEQYPLAWLYFVPFVLVSAFVMMNVVVGIVVNTISEASDDAKKEKALENKETVGSALRIEMIALKKQIEKVELLVAEYDKNVGENNDNAKHSDPE